MKGLERDSIRRRTDVTVVIVTSPSPSIPSTTLIDSCIESIFEKVPELQKAKIMIVMDGYKLHPENKLKQGKITLELEARYNLYYDALKTKYHDPQFSIERLQKHMGFAFAVKHALDTCSTSYAMICQYDRIFCCSFRRLHELIQTMELHDHIRYIG